MKAKSIDKIGTYIITGISMLVVLLLVSLLSYIIIKGFDSISISFLTGSSKIGEAGSGIGPQLFNSFYLLIITLIFTVPLGIGGGIYLSEYAKDGVFVKVIRLCIETLASIPSIVAGLFGLLIFVNTAGFGFTILGGALTLTILNLPAMTMVSEQAIKSGGKNIKEASLGLGATKFQTIKRVILKTAIPQILTGIILASGRIFGEAAALLYTAGMSAFPLKFSNVSLTGKISPFSVMRPAETLAVYIWKVNSEGMIPDATKVANGASAVLIIMVLLFNILARIIGKKLYTKHTGGI